MTDNEIIKALECCTIREMDCKNCLNKNQGLHCIYETMKLALDLINRHKADIERLNIESETLATQLKGAYEQIHKLNIAKSEAIKEFCEKRGIKYVEDDI